MLTHPQNQLGASLLAHKVVITDMLDNTMLPQLSMVAHRQLCIEELENHDLSSMQAHQVIIFETGTNVPETDEERNSIHTNSFNYQSTEYSEKYLHSKASHENIQLNDHYLGTPSIQGHQQNTIQRDQTNSIDEDNDFIKPSFVKHQMNINTDDMQPVSSMVAHNVSPTAGSESGFLQSHRQITTENREHVEKGAQEHGREINMATSHNETINNRIIHQTNKDIVNFAYKPMEEKVDTKDIFINTLESSVTIKNEEMGDTFEDEKVNVFSNMAVSTEAIIPSIPHEIETSYKDLNLIDQTLKQQIILDEKELEENVMVSGTEFCSSMVSHTLENKSEIEEFLSSSMAHNVTPLDNEEYENIYSKITHQPLIYTQNQEDTSIEKQADNLHDNVENILKNEAENVISNAPEDSVTKEITNRRSQARLQGLFNPHQLQKRFGRSGKLSRLQRLQRTQERLEKEQGERESSLAGDLATREDLKEDVERDVNITDDNDHIENVDPQVASDESLSCQSLPCEETLTTTHESNNIEQTSESNIYSSKHTYADETSNEYKTKIQRIQELQRIVEEEIGNFETQRKEFSTSPLEETVLSNVRGISFPLEISIHSKTLGKRSNSPREDIEDNTVDKRSEEIDPNLKKRVKDKEEKFNEQIYGDKSEIMPVSDVINDSSVTTFSTPSDISRSGFRSFVDSLDCDSGFEGSPDFKELPRNPSKKQSSLKINTTETKIQDNKNLESSLNNESHQMEGDKLKLESSAKQSIPETKVLDKKSDIRTPKVEESPKLKKKAGIKQSFTTSAFKEGVMNRTYKLRFRVNLDHINETEKPSIIRSLLNFFKSHTVFRK